MNDKPEMCCDLVMKGGITSGVLYPSAIREIAERFWIVGIGGTSAGAIAASVAAAAEYRRRISGTLEGYDRLEAMARELAEPGRLLSLFRPDRETRKLFKLALKFMEGRAGMSAKLSVGRRLLFSRKKTFGRVVDNMFGLCSGMANGNRVAGKPALTEWLADQIDLAAGKEGGPLTLADLHSAPAPELLQAHQAGLPGPARSIDFRAVTTCLTFGRPVEIPFRERIFAFDPGEWSRLFPKRVVDHLVTEGEKIDSEVLKRDGRLPLPVDQLPVVIAARMSLSFPLLFSQVPLYAVNYHKEGEPLERVWFSDGGVTSNFPMHRFDSLYPSWPTLGINLQYTDKSRVPQRRRLAREGTMVYLPSNRSGGVLDLWKVFDRGENPIGQIAGLAGAIFRSAQVWHDNAFLKLPGFRDRIAEIWLDPDEGGMNLDMDPATVKTLTERGADAGRQIAQRFADASPTESMSWTGHRWARFRSGMAGLMEALHDFRASAGSVTPGHPTLDDLLADRDTPPTYRFDSESQREAARTATKALLELADEIAGLEVCDEEPAARPFCGPPRPRVEYGSRAPI